MGDDKTVLESVLETDVERKELLEEDAKLQNSENPDD